MKIILLLLVTAYRTALSPLLPATCRFYPSCSSYAQEAIRIHGGMRGGWLAARRLLRCRPGGAHGVDFVPPARSRLHPVKR